MNKEIDMNRLIIPESQGYQRKDTVISKDGKIEVYFNDIESRLCDLIRSADVVVGCVAWLTSHIILDALRRRSVSLVVQKEDFLRPDMTGDLNWKVNLRRRYDQLGCSLDRYHAGDLVSQLSVCGDVNIRPIRCVGNYNRDKNPAHPRMHNKFLVFCNREENDERDYLDPYQVWTGSFNFTQNSTFSFENALLIKDQEITKGYFDEWQHILALSEPIDWESDWAAPEWRIGT